MSYRVICALGDSITNGYWDEEGLGWFGRLSTMLAKKYPYKFGFNNLGMDGDTSFDVLYRLRGEALSRNPDILLIAIGVNDLIRWLAPDAPFDLSPGKRFEIWQNILKTAKAAAENILVMSILPIEESRMPCEGSFGRLLYSFNKDIDAYNTEISGWCKEFDIPFLDQSTVWKKLNIQEHLYDAAHPNAKGHQMMANTVFEEMKKLGWLTST